MLDDFIDSDSDVEIQVSNRIFSIINICTYHILKICFFCLQNNQERILEDEEFLSNFDNFDVFSVYKHDPISSLKPEEKDLIDSCGDQDLKQLLFLNRKKNLSLILLYKKLQDILMECRQCIIEKSSILKEHINTLKLNNHSYGAWRLGAPYFKDKNLFPSPYNQDVSKKQKNNELFIYDLVPLNKWSNFECDKVINGVRINYEYNKKKCKETTDGDNSEYPPLFSNKNINWGRIASVFVNGM